MTLKLLDVGDNPRDGGLSHGRAFPREIRDNVATYLARFAHAGMAREESIRRGADWLPRLRAFDPDYVLEMEGIAEGADVPLAEIALLSVRYELSYLAFGREDGTLKTDGCTAFAALPEVTRSGEMWIGQNWDWLARVRGRCFVLRAKRKNKPGFVCLTQAGIPGGMTGLNEAGIGVCVNGLTTPEDGRDPDGLPHHLRVRAILSARTFTEALKPVMGTRHVGSTHFLIAHAGGEALGLEASPSRINALNPEDGLYTHSNHFVGPTAGAGFERKHPSTLFRAKRLERKIRQGNKPLDLALARDLLSDHFSHPNSICAHPDPEISDVERTTTVASVVLALDRRTLYASDGPPCESPYEAYPLAA